MIITSVLLLAILIVLIGILTAVKTGFNEVITGLAAVAASESRE